MTRVTPLTLLTFCVTDDIVFKDRVQVALRIASALDITHFHGRCGVGDLRQLCYHSTTINSRQPQNYIKFFFNLIEESSKFSDLQCLASTRQFPAVHNR